MSLGLKHQTAGEFAARFWACVRVARSGNDQIEYCRLLYWLERRLVNADITDTQARNSFNTAFNRTLTAGQWTTLRTTRIQPAHARYAAILAEGDL